MSGRASEIADELYALAPDEFTAARDAAAKRARDDGERELAGAVKQWRRPSIGAWLVNRLVRTNPAELDDLLDLGASLREAQDALDGAELRTLSRQRHQAVRGLTELARAAAGRQKIADAAQREFESTLDAALADEAAANAVRTGRLIRALSSSGLEAVDLTDAVAGPDDNPPRPRRPKPPARPATKEKDDRARAAVAEARATLGDRQAELDRAEQELDDARGAARTAREQVEQLENELDRARVGLATADAARRETETAAKKSARARDAARRDLETAERKLARE
jgi:hypothetical protein